MAIAQLSNSVIFSVNHKIIKSMAKKKNNFDNCYHENYFQKQIHIALKCTQESQ